MIEVPNIESFIELYEKYRQDNKLVQDIKIEKIERFTIYEFAQYDEMKGIYLNRAVHQLTEEFMRVALKYEGDVFHIRINKESTLERRPDINAYDAVFRIAIYVFSSLRFNLAAVSR